MSALEFGLVLALTFDKALPSCPFSEEEECVHSAWVEKVNKSVKIRG